ncbi:DUF6128 domain-containing protein [uncultured Eubacterium sp.]|uniref:DUF6128 domain-containing protein n=1 Tax=uncultured Eubacterium sp. TaxID=165185 RepID=UPI0025E625F3|nr:DUF6128 domain-containing protein [uncultured Eubacterium sp.]
MPGYQRFVTYLFLYEEEKKLENCGFAKVEIRQDQCRIQLQVKGIRQESVDVYLLNQNVMEPEGVLLGSMQTKNGVAEQTFFCNSNHVGESEYAIGQMRGIYIPLEHAEFVASQWDDEVTVWGRFHPWRPKVEESSAEELSESMDTVENAENSDTEAVAEIISNGNEKDSSGGAEGIEKRAKYQDNVAQKNEEQRVENDSASELHATQTSSAMAHPLQLSWVQQWERFTAAHPLICPFDEDDHVYAVKLKLQDFTILPKRYQYLANNNFLLHGYFNYEMILFGYMEEEKRRWFLGVPGVFSNQEQLLAGIFGFPEFRTKQVTRQKTGEYGYWCRYLD